MTQYPEMENYVPVPHQHVLLTDDNRINLFREAIENMVKPGGAVLDVGFGTGLLSFFASKKARKVYAVENNERRYRAGMKYLRDNNLEGKIELVRASPATFVPPEPVQTVLCEMLHTGLLNEPYVAVLNEVRRNLVKNHNGPFTVLPYLALNCVQPVDVNFSYHGYHVRAPRYQHAYWVDERVTTLAEPQVFWVTDFQSHNDLAVNAAVTMKIARKGRLNAVRMITKHVLSNNALNGRLIEWFSHYLIVPVENEMAVGPRDRITIGVSYEAGGGLADLMLSVREAQESSRNILE